jgi:hypothetical protein
MPAIELAARPVYRAPTAGRCFLTPRGAADAEASAMLKRKYPNEQPEYENGQMYFSGYHWSSDEQLKRVHKRLMRNLLRHLRTAKKGTQQ